MPPVHGRLHGISSPSHGGSPSVRGKWASSAPPHGQLVFFAEILATAGVSDRWVDQCPLSCTSPNASSNRDVLGTLMLGIRSGSKRHAHIAGVRGDAVAAQALGMQGVVSVDSVPLLRLFDALGAHQPALVRGDCGYGNQDIIDICE